MERDIDEKFVFCLQCNAYLYATCKTDPAQSNDVFIPCPYECQSDGTMLKPPNYGKYGRS